MDTQNINECLVQTHCIGTVESVDTRKVIVNVENESVLNVLKINDIVAMLETEIINCNVTKFI